jgi:hypothetical protein
MLFVLSNLFLIVNDDFVGNLLGLLPDLLFSSLPQTGGSRFALFQLASFDNLPVGYSQCVDTHILCPVLR